MEISIAILTQNLIAETETEIKGNNPKFNYRMLTPGSQIWIKCKIPDCSLRKMCSFGVRQYHCSKNYRKHQQNSISYHAEKRLHLGAIIQLRTAWKVSKYWVFSGPYFSVIGRNTKIYEVNVCIQSEYRKKRTRKNSEICRFLCNVETKIIYRKMASWTCGIMIEAKPALHVVTNLLLVSSNCSEQYPE